MENKSFKVKIPWAKRYEKLAYRLKRFTNEIEYFKKAGIIINSDAKIDRETMLKFLDANP